MSKRMLRPESVRFFPKKRPSSESCNSAKVHDFCVSRRSWWATLARDFQNMRACVVCVSRAPHSTPRGECARQARPHAKRPPPTTDCRPPTTTTGTSSRRRAATTQRTQRQHQLSTRARASTARPPRNRAAAHRAAQGAPPHRPQHDCRRRRLYFVVTALRRHVGASRI